MAGILTPDHLTPLTERIIGAGIEVHRELGPGLLERSYQRALTIELELIGLPYEAQVVIPATYKGHDIGIYCVDFIVAKSVVVEVKAVERYEPVFEAQILTYLRVTRLPIGLLLNFNSRWLRQGLRRFALQPE
jgi:GxxExxY protein